MVSRGLESTAAQRREQENFRAQDHERQEVGIGASAGTPVDTAAGQHVKRFILD